MKVGKYDVELINIAKGICCCGIKRKANLHIVFKAKGKCCHLFVCENCIEKNSYTTAQMISVLEKGD